MKLTLYTVNACCGKKSIMSVIDRPIDRALINNFISLGFREAAHFSASGIMYLDSNDFIISGPFGSNKLTIKCKDTDCDEKLNNLKKLLEAF